eukprot:362989-Chlamydomonas_euryale.AAC.12
MSCVLAQLLVPIWLVHERLDATVFLERVLQQVRNAAEAAVVRLVDGDARRPQPTPLHANGAVANDAILWVLVLKAVRTQPRASRHLLSHVFQHLAIADQQARAAERAARGATLAALRLADALLGRITRGAARAALLATQLLLAAEVTRDADRRVVQAATALTAAADFLQLLLKFR